MALHVQVINGELKAVLPGYRASATMTPVPLPNRFRPDCKPPGTFLGPVGALHSKPGMYFGPVGGCSSATRPTSALGQRCHAPTRYVKPFALSRAPAADGHVAVVHTQDEYYILALPPLP